ncbi:MAG TPA: hypothetical protein VFT22_15425 [Kofleriaceae bacterium]|nr:hypothetical protein [Kofleriaceae bacterium]
MTGQPRRPGGKLSAAGPGARLAVAALAVVAVSAVGRAPALADPTRLVTPPAGWRSDPEQATALAQRFAATSHFGGLPAVTAVEAYVSDPPGAALFVTRATATLATAAPGSAAPGAPDERARPELGRLARVALDELRGGPARAALAGGSADERGWHEQVEADRRQVTATLAWADAASHTVDTARVVVASDGRRVVAVTGECLAGDDGDRALAACRAALATLDPGVPAASRVGLELAPATAGGDTAATGEPRARSPSMSSAPESSRLGDGPRVVFPPTAIPVAPRPVDRRPVYIGAGVLLLALMFWWNRRRRDRFDREDQRAGRRAGPVRAARADRDPEADGDPARKDARDDAGDEDADDLHAAARGDTSPPSRPPSQLPSQPASQNDRQS